MRIINQKKDLEAGAMKKLTFIFTFFTILLSANSLLAEVTVGILPLKGAGSKIKNIDNQIKSCLTRSGGLAIVEEKMLKEIIKVHEKAQSLGSAYHDISKLKSAEYLVTGTVESGKLTLSAVDVNSGTSLFTRQVNIATRDKGYQVRKLCGEIRSAILIHSASKQREVPEEAGPYMDLLNNFVASLGKGKTAPYRYLVFYKDGKYQRPAKGDRAMEEKAGRFVMVLRRNLIRSKLSYIYLKSAPPWVYLNVIAKKLGKKTKHQFGIIELDDGSLGIGIYKPME
jgi:hypothetical protein